MLNKKVKPLVSVVIPIYKRKKLATRAIKSVLNQKFFDFIKTEIIVSDDEDEISLISKNRRYYKNISSNIKYIVNKHEEGPGGNRQTGLDLVSGKYVVFLDSDDELKPQFISIMSTYLREDKFIAAVCLSESSYENKINFWRKFKLNVLSSIRDFFLIFQYMFNQRKLAPSAFYLCQLSHMMFRRRFINLQKFNYEYRRGGEDWDFIIQTLKRGEIGISLQKLTKFRYTSGSVITDPINWLNKWKSYELLLSKLTKKFKRFPYYYLFQAYIALFSR